MRLLAEWLPQQRWFPGRGVALSDILIVSDVLLRDGDPALRHLIVQAPLASGTVGRFQVPVGYRAKLPAQLSSAQIGHQDGMACYDALHDPELAQVLLDGISEQRHVGPLRFIREADAPDFTGFPGGRVLGAEQSNTSLVFGDQAILKVLRRLFPGPNPDLEVADALARLGSTRVAAPYGWIETDLDGEPMLLAVLSTFLAGAREGWTLALEHLRQLYDRTDGPSRDQLTAPVSVGAIRADGGAENRGLPFTEEARQLGRMTAELHADMARAFGNRAMAESELAGLANDMHAKLTEALVVVPDLAGYEARIRSAYDNMARLTGPVTVQRIHGDYHLGQVLLGPRGWVALDFEGEPAVPLAIRRAPAPALRDVAGMLRSFDYAARQQLVGHPAAEPLAPVADAWARQCQAAFCSGYADGGGVDPDGHGTLLHALTLEKAVYEVVYESRHRPAWLSIPLDFVAAA
jgi:maltokinase